MKSVLIKDTTRAQREEIVRRKKDSCVIVAFLTA